MSRGYRLSKSIALANYYADLDNLANFAVYQTSDPEAQQRAAARRPGARDYYYNPAPAGEYRGGANTKDMGIVVDPRYNYGYKSAEEIAASGNMQREKLRPMSTGQRMSRLQYQAGQQGARLRRWAGANKRNLMIGGGAAAGLGALGTAGYLGYRAMNPDEQV